MALHTYLPAGMEGFVKQLIIELAAAAVLIYVCFGDICNKCCH